MAYELIVSTSSIGVFSTLWGFHRVCLRENRPDSTPILYVSDNLTARLTSDEDRTDATSNLLVVEELYFLAILLILHSFTIRIVPPNLRDDEVFRSDFRGSNNVSG